MPTPSAPARALAATALLALALSLGAPGAAVATGTGGAGGTGGTGQGAGRQAEPGRGTSSCPASTAQQSTRAARAVFTGTVTESVRTDTTDGVGDGETYAQQVTVTRVYQGDLGSDTVEVLSERQPQQCSLGRLPVGTAYVFFVQGDGSAEEPWTAVGGGGTAAADPRLVSQVERLLGPGEQPVAPTQETAEFTTVGDTSRTPLARLAAPGAALMLIGLLGLLAVGRLSRRS